ncbi:hypothetical protein KY290_030932 [Solanum tuberosum]|uniref:Protein kinase domain-containing protein n=1 Tax=Solanum tuberosum TaxID=4113 RepID=A0ABQ7U9M3_SOLTU|nr:hypothetical protein KY290_030932 [Solanum tuberosum]
MWKGPWYVPELRVLNLRNNSLTGIIPPFVGNATKLMNFDLSGNRINGSIPMEIGNISQLTELFLDDNELTGPIPVTLFNNSSLLNVALGINSLFGPLLLDEGIIVSNLKFLSISNNQISGCIPSNICQLTELKVLSISFNNITGDIPRNIGCLSKLEGFYIGYNPIKGTIPTSLGNISTLQYLYCGNNGISGQIPPELGKLSNLRELSFDSNYNLIGQIPEAIFNIYSLEIIDFSFNNLSGRIPTTTGLHLRNLKGLDLGVNQLEGEIPLFITNASKLEILSLVQNFLTRTIPTNLGNLRELLSLMLKYLQVGFNPLNGVLPNSIGNLSSTIENFEIGDSHINGLIPTSIGNMSGLTALIFEENSFTGSIPSEIGSIKQLQGLSLFNNKLQGHIPEAVCHLSKLVLLFLDGNDLSGSIPECLGNLSMLQHLYLGSNKLSSTFPLSLWKMSGLLYLDVSQNSIEGEIPSDIAGLKAIVELHLSYNHFSGMIPSQLGDLQNLKSLDLSNNSFSDSMPLSFANLISLEFLNLSLNALSGVVPIGGVFSNSTLQSVLGNKGLCGMHILEIPACAITNPGKQSKLKEVVLKIVTPVVISSFLIFLLVSIWIMKRKKKGKSKDVEKGSSGSMYKGTLSSGTVVAIKVRDLENEQVCKRFDTECEVMRNVRHRNLVPVITTCSSDYIRAFLLKYMSNGSLENWLYREESHLNLLQRITITLDVAVAIEYLHHGHNSPIVHCDLKPANVLLDEDMVTHVGDFGISKILVVSKSMAHTETLGTLGYIAPEYGLEGIVSSSGDVYSYGIMLMEVLTKRRPTDEVIRNENLDIRKWITQSFSGTMMDVVDANIFSEEEQITSKSEICIASMIELALDCTTEMPESRITMKDVVKRLTKIKNTWATRG